MANAPTFCTSSLATVPTYTSAPLGSADPPAVLTKWRTANIEGIIASEGVPSGAGSSGTPLRRALPKSIASMPSTRRRARAVDVTSCACAGDKFEEKWPGEAVQWRSVFMLASSPNTPTDADKGEQQQ